MMQVIILGADEAYGGSAADDITTGDAAVNITTSAGNVTVSIIFLESDGYMVVLSSAGEDLAEGAVYMLEITGGTDETVRIHSDQGTGFNAKGNSTDASINLVSGGIGLYSALNSDNAITIESNGGSDETIQIRSNQGTGVGNC